MSFNHRLPALMTATLASIALTFCVLAAMVCDFVEINSRPGSLLLSAGGEELMRVTATFGLFCEEEFYNGEDDMWELSQIFFFLSSSLGGVAVVLAWAVSIVMPPTNFNWRLLSFLSALSAVVQVPIFLIFESAPCKVSEVQTCTFSMGSYYLIGSTALWVVVTFCTQCLDPPLWAVELSAWRIPKHSTHHTILNRSDEELGHHGFSLQQNIGARKRVSKAEHHSRQSELSIPAVSTDSMKDEEFDLQSPSRSSDTSDSRVMYTRGNDRNQFDHQSKTLHVHMDAEPRIADEGWLDATPANSSARSGIENVTYFRPNIPSIATECIRVPTSNPTIDREALKSPGRRSHNGTTDSRKSRSRVKSIAGSSTMILADLQAQAAIISSSGALIDSTNEEYSDRVPLTSNGNNAAEKYSLGIRALTKKLNHDAKHRRSRRQRRRNGYEPMMEDDDSDDEPYMSPPIEVKIKPFANFDNVDFNQDFTDDENEDLMDGWNALHKATTNGVRMGLQEGYSDDGEKIQFDSPVQGYHSDPELMYYPSDASRSHVSLSELNASGRPGSQRQEDASTLSTLSGSRARSNDCKKSRGRNGRRKRKQSSPNVSIVSAGSLLDVTIDEETDQDVMEEISAEEEGIRGILGAYKMERTLSEPLPRPTDDMRSRPGLRDDLETISLNTSRLPCRRPGEQFGNSSSPGVSAFERPVVATAEEATRRRIPTATMFLPLPTLEHSEVIHEQLPKRRVSSGARPRPTIPCLKPYVETRSLSLSPRRDRTWKVETGRNDVTSLGGVHTQSATWLDESTASHSSHSTRSNLSTRAREYRIKRMQYMNVATNQPAGDDSYTKDRQASVHARRRTPNEEVRPNFSSTNRPYYGLNSQFTENPLSVQIDSNGVVQDRNSSPEDFSDLKTDSTPMDLPKFTANVAKHITLSPTSVEKTIDSPELSPIMKDETEKMHQYEGDEDSKQDGQEFPTVTTAASETPTPEDTSSANYESEAVDEFPIDTDIGLKTSIPHNEDSSQEQYLVDEDFDKYGNVDMDDLDLQLIAVRRPIGKEYGDDEVSL